ncbi:MAG TPA: chorismate-binding protein, partial [Sulfurovum sp.]
GVNAAVVGLLAAVLINTVFPSGVHSYLDGAIAVIGLVIFRTFKIPVLYMITLFILIGVAFNF